MKDDQNSEIHQLIFGPWTIKEEITQVILDLFTNPEHSSPTVNIFNALGNMGLILHNIASFQTSINKSLWISSPLIVKSFGTTLLNELFTVYTVSPERLQEHWVEEISRAEFEMAKAGNKRKREDSDEEGYEADIEPGRFQATDGRKKKIWIGNGAEQSGSKKDKEMDGSKENDSEDYFTALEQMEVADQGQTDPEDEDATDDTNDENAMDDPGME